MYFPSFALIGGCALSAVLFLYRPASAQSRTSAALPQFEAADAHSEGPEIGYPSLVATNRLVSAFSPRSSGNVLGLDVAN